MKKNIILMVLIVTASLFSSCLKNEEPESLKELRGAKSEFIRAEATYKLAEAAYQDALTKFQDAQTENQTLQNELQKIKNQEEEQLLEIAKLNVEIKKCEVAKAQAETDAKKAEYEKLIASYEVEKAKYENQIEGLKMDLEEAIKTHELAMTVLLTQIANAQAEYENALKTIEAEKYTLTPEQQAIINMYSDALTAVMDGGPYMMNGQTLDAGDGITDYQIQLVAANAQLQQDSYLWDRDSLTTLNRLVIDSISFDYEASWKMEEVTLFTLFTNQTSIEEWENSVKDIENLILESQAEQATLKTELARLQDEQAPITAQKNDIIRVRDYKIDSIEVIADAIATNGLGIDDPVGTEKYALEQEQNAIATFPLGIDDPAGTEKYVLEQQQNAIATNGLGIDDPVGTEKYAIEQQQNAIATEALGTPDPAGTEKYAIEQQQKAIAVNPPYTPDPVGTEKYYKELEIDSLNTLLNAYVNEAILPQDGILAIPSEIENDFITTVAMGIGYPGIQVSPFEFDNTKQYYYPGDILSANGANAPETWLSGDANLYTYFENIRTDLYSSDLILTDSELAAKRQEIANDRENFDANQKKAYNEAKEAWKNALDVVNANASTYKIDYDKDLQAITLDAWVKYLAIATPTASDKETVVAAIQHYRTVRDALTKNPYTVVDGGDTYPIQDILTKVNVDTYQTDINNFLYGDPKLSMSLYDGCATDGPLLVWQEQSQALWGWGMRMTEEVNAAYFGSDWNLVYYPGLAQARVANVGNIIARINKLGWVAFSQNYSVYSDVYVNIPNLQTGLWWAYIAENARLEYEQSIVDNQAAYKELYQDVVEIVTAYAEEIAADEAYLADNQQKEDVVEEEINILWTRATALDDEILALIAKAELLDKDIAEVIARAELIDKDILEVIAKADAMDVDINTLIEAAALIRLEENEIRAKCAELTAELDALDAELTLQINICTSSIAQEVNHEANLGNLKVQYLVYIQNAYQDITDGMDPQAFNKSSDIYKAFVKHIETLTRELADIQDDAAQANMLLAQFRNGVSNTEIIWRDLIANDEAEIKRIEAQLEILNHLFEQYTEALRNVLAVLSGSSENA